MLAHLLIAFLIFAGNQAPAAGGALKFTAPAGWQPRDASSSMRVAEFVLPGTRDSADGKSQSADAELVVYFFGGSGGSVDANIQRWLGQMQQPDGRETKDVAVHDVRTVNGLKVSTLDVSGIYVAEVRPGSSERHNSPAFRMRTAIVETPRGPYYIKLVGPAPTIAKWDGSYNEFLSSLNFAQ
jgi:hypothetical protein